MLNNSAAKYILHIDGLRAVAVLGVVLFHLDISGFSGGFVGVDIFFVISGYLISSHLLTEIQSGHFSFKGFYNRRVRRLLPALIFTLMATFLVGCFIFPAANLERLAGSTLFSLFSLANVFFFSEAGYFDSAATLKPLLHMWSLSVEEQFYLVWPALLLFLASRKHVLFSVLALGAASFIFSELYFHINPKAVFFLTPFRIGEFAIGALLYWAGRYQNPYSWLDELLCVLGLLFVGLSIACFSESMRFPGFSAVLPCVGAALLIYSGKARYAGWVLRNRLMVLVGLISYSLYLVHWPAIVYYKYMTLSTLNFFDQLILFAGSVLLAIPMYLFVEKPFRAKVEGRFKLSASVFYGLLILMVSSLVVVMANVIQNEGWPWRVDARQISKGEIREGMGRRTDIYDALCTKRTWEKCAAPSEDKDRNVFVIGDSHALDGLNIFSQAYPSYYYTMRDLGGCPPIVESDLGIFSPDHPKRKECIQLNLERFAQIDKNAYHMIVISVLFDWYKPEHLMHAIARIKEHSDARIIVLGNYIQLNNDFTDLVNSGVEVKQRQDVVKHFAEFEKQLMDMSGDQYQFVSKKDLFCDGDGIESCTFWVGDVPVMYDQHHLSLEATTYFAVLLREKYPELAYKFNNTTSR